MPIASKHIVPMHGAASYRAEMSMKQRVFPLGEEKISAEASFVVPRGTNRETRGYMPSQILEQQKRSAFSTNAQSRFVSVVLDGVQGLPRLARHSSNA